MTPSPQRSKRVQIKAWVVVSYDRGVESADALVEQECPAALGSDALAVYQTKQDALAHGTRHGYILPCTITYKPPKKR